MALDRSICIDQAIVEIRIHQVRRMANIYRNAAYVNVWLGPSNESTEMGMRMLKSNYWLYHDHVSVPKARTKRYRN